MPTDAVRVAEGAPLPPGVAAGAHEALAILWAKKAALDAGVSRTEIDAHAWTAEVRLTAEPVAAA